MNTCTFTIPKPPTARIMRSIKDPWLRQEVRRYAGDPWTRLIGAGVALRYYSPPRSLHRRILAGYKPAIHRAVEAWVAGLSPEELRTIHDLFHAMVFALRLDLADLEAQFTVEPEWQAQWLYACQTRDDLEALRELLATDGSYDYDSDLRDLDADAWAFALTVPPFSDDLRLSAASTFDPNAWWTFPLRDHGTTLP